MVRFFQGVVFPLLGYNVPLPSDICAIVIVFVQKRFPIAICTFTIFKSIRAVITGMGHCVAENIRNSQYFSPKLFQRWNIFSGFSPAVVFPLLGYNVLVPPSFVLCAIFRIITWHRIFCPEIFKRGNILSPKIFKRGV